METMRIAIIGTPRSGNSWVRRVLSQTLDLKEMSFHHPAEIPKTLPERLVMQLHWYREPNFQAVLRSHDFQIIVLSRHPLDVLVSVLHFVRHEPETARWLDGEVNLPPAMKYWVPTSVDFLNYSKSLGAENLLSVSYQWQHEQAAIKLRYEKLAGNPKAEFAAVIARLGARPEKLDHGLFAARFTFFQNLSNHHGWQGKQNTWRKLIIPGDALHIYLRHRRVFQSLGYHVPVNILSRRRAEHNWRRLVS